MNVREYLLGPFGVVRGIRVGRAKLTERIRLARSVLRSSSGSLCLVSVGCFAWPLRHQHNRDKLKDICAHPVRQLPKLIEPWHIIGLGLAIAFAGVVWQARRMPKVDPEVMFLRAELTDAQHDLTARRQFNLENPPSSSTIPSLPIVVYTERDIRELLDALNDAHNLMQKDVAPIFNRIGTLAASWQGAIPNQGVRVFAQTLSELRDQVQSAVWPKVNDFVYRLHDRYTDQIRFAIALDSEAAKGELTRALDVAIDALGMLPDHPELRTIGLVAPQFAEVNKQYNLVHQWTETAKSRTEEMTKNLRTKGVTGFEQK
jgi:hypothetical protein